MTTIRDQQKDQQKDQLSERFEAYEILRREQRLVMSLDDAADTALSWFDTFGAHEGVIPHDGERVAERLREALAEVHKKA